MNWQIFLYSAACGKAVADIVFVLDDSGSVGKENFQKIKKFTIESIRSLKIAKNHVRVAAISYSTTAVVNFYLSRYNDHWSLDNAIRSIRYRRGGTNTHLALRLVQSVFSKRYGDRPDAQNIAIVITDGVSHRPSLTVLEANKLQKAGVTMFSIGVGRRLKQSELRAMASKPTAQHIFNVNNFDALDSIAKKITTKTCKVGKYIQVLFQSYFNYIKWAGEGAIKVRIWNTFMKFVFFSRIINFDDHLIPKPTFFHTMRRL